ncbi:MAG: helix-turn-helix transcriptional regulator [Chitinophagaceae bacterium]|nr:helix-turn-helix transcriptional regulator [Chitinophagaceae bacterium]
MEADIHTLYKSDFYNIIDFKCRCIDCRTSKPEYSDSFCIGFVRKGNFLFNVFRHSLDSYSGCALITKPGYEHTVTHTHTVPDECTIFDFNMNFYKDLKEHFSKKTSFFHNHDVHSTLIKTTAEIEFLHYNILQLALVKSGSKLEIDQLVMEMLEKMLGCISEYRPDRRIHSKLKRNHLITIERAKEFITQQFSNDISLMDIANYCHVSPFHFSRIFKTFTSCSPHQFLLSIRLKNAELLLRNTSLPVADVAFSSGFNSIQYFTTAFSQKYHCPPAKFSVDN